MNTEVDNARVESISIWPNWLASHFVISIRCSDKKETKFVATIKTAVNEQFVLCNAETREPWIIVKSKAGEAVIETPTGRDIGSIQYRLWGIALVLGGRVAIFDAVRTPVAYIAPNEPWQLKQLYCYTKRKFQIVDAAGIKHGDILIVRNLLKISEVRCCLSVTDRHLIPDHYLISACIIIVRRLLFVP